MSKVLFAVRDYFFPPVCAICGRAGTFLCEECESDLSSGFKPDKTHIRGGNGYIDEAFHAFEYTNPRVRGLIMQMKKNDYENYRVALTPYIEKALKICGFAEQSDAVVYSPRKIMAKRRNSVDQAEVLSKTVSGITGIRHSSAVKRRGISFTQHKLNEKLRRANVKGKFRCAERFDGENVLLIDDIVTTGATVNEIAHILKQNGAMKVYVFALAH